MILFKNNLLSRQTRLLSKVSVLSISVRFSKNVAKNAVQNTVQSTTPKTAHHTFTQAQTANVCGRNAFSSSFSQTLQPRASQQARAQQAAANLPLGLNKIGIANSNNSNTNSNNTTIPASTYNTKNVPTNNTLIPKSNSSYSSLFTKIDTRSKINPQGIYTDYQNPVFSSFSSNTNKNFANKIFIGVKIFDFNNNFTGLWLGHLYSTKKKYFNAQGYLDENEKVSDNTNIKGFAGPQFRSISMIVEDKDLQFYSGYLDPKIANEGLLEINFYSLVYNAMLSTNPGTVTYTLAKQIDPGIFWFSDPNNR